MNKKLFILAILILLCLITACTGKTAEETTDTANDETEPEVVIEEWPVVMGPAVGGWPVYRQNLQNTGYQPLPGNMSKTPVDHLLLQMANDPGSSFFAKDIDGDGNPEFFLIEAGRFVGISSSGEDMWRTEPMLAFKIYDILDLNNDGKPEIFAFGERSIVILDPFNGDVLYQYFFDEQPNRPRFILHDFDKDGCVEAIIWIYKNDDWKIFKFGESGGKFTGELFNVINTPQYDSGSYYPGIMVMDMDNDGYDELVMVRKYGISVFNARELCSVKGASDKPLYECSYPVIPVGEGRFYGYTVAGDFDGDGYPDIANVSDGVYYHVDFMKGGNGTLTRVWDKEFGYSSQKNKDGKYDIIHTINDSVYDFDGDGKAEMVLNHFVHEANQTVGEWTLYILDVLTGNERVALPGKYARYEVHDVLPDGRSIFFVTNEDAMNISATASYELWSFDNNGNFTQIGDLNDYSLVFRPRPDFGNNISPLAAHQENRLYTLDINGDGQNELIVRGGGNYVALSFDIAGKMTVVKTMSIPGTVMADFKDKDGKIGFMVYGSNGYMIVTDIDGKEMFTRLGQGGSVAGQVTVGDVDGDGRNEVVFYKGGEFVVCRYRDGVLHELWRKTGQGRRSHDNKITIDLVDMTGDGTLNIVTQSSDGTYPKIDVWNGDGTLLWSVTLDYAPDGTPLDVKPYGIKSWTYGDFNGDGIMDIAVGLEVVYINGCTGIIDGATRKLVYVTPSNVDIDYKEAGGILVSRCTYAAPGIYASADLDGDGCDEVYFVALEAFMRISYVEGEYKLDTYVGVFNPEKRMFYYSTPILVQLDNDGPIDILHSGGFSEFSAYPGEMEMQAITGKTRYLWYVNYPEDSDAYARQLGVGDIDGDGINEVIAQYTKSEIPGMLAVYSGIDGSLKWEMDLAAEFGGSNVIVEDILTCDIDGDGKAEILFVTNTGYAAAIKGDGTILWKVYVGVKLSNIVIADIDNCGYPEIVFSGSDGYYHMIRGQNG